MQDRFRFRWWDYYDKEYRYNVQDLFETDCFFSVCGKDCWGNPSEESADNFGDLLDLQDKGSGVIEQCTGLKDKNGKLIYEGDILKINHYNGYWKVIYQGKLGKYCLDNAQGHLKGIDQFLWSDFEVIGNIHENPELLEEK